MARQSKPKGESDAAARSTVSAKVLGVNLSELMKIHDTLNSNPTVAKRTGMSASTIHRMRHGEVDATLRTLEKLAGAFGVRPWELLLPGFDAANRAPAKPLSDKVRKLLAEIAKEIGD